jgi:monofunctional glycosyltransferase
MARSRRPRRCLRWLLLLLLPPLLSVLQVLALRWVDPPTSAFMLARQWQAWQSGDAGFALDYRWVSLQDMAPHLPLALVAAEDQLFPQHRGFDQDSIREALDRRREGRSLRGASTISQQTAKNLFLWSGRSWMRKGLEAWYTLLLEALLPKRRILELYANIAEFGDGIYGAEAAAQRWFGKPARLLTPNEAARLAAVLPSPKRYVANPPGPYVRERAAWVERQMLQLGGPAYLDACCR